MSKISDMYEQIKLQQYTLIKTKLQEAVKARKEKRELSGEEKEDYTFTDDEVSILIRMLDEQGLTEGKDFINFVQSDYDAPDYSVFVIKIDGDYIGISTNNWGGKDIPNITNIESIREMIDGFEGVELEEDMLKMVNLTDIDLDQIQIIEPLDEEVRKAKDTRQLFEKSLLRDDVVEYYLSKTSAELEAEFGPEVAKMVGFEQKNSHHCYDLWEHTLRTVEGIKAEGLTPEQFKKLRIAAFFHDIGKPDVSKFNEQTGQQVFYGHAMHSVDVASPILEKLGYSEQEIAQLGFFIGHHDDFISYKSKLAPFMRNHEFIRGIDSATVAEKVIENKFDFEAMGYDKDQVRAICYTLAHGQNPDFKVKNQPIVIDVNMDEVRARMDSGKYDASYDASLEDYQMLLQLCKADAGAQSEVAMQKGKVVGSKAEKLENMGNIEASLPEAYRDAVAIMKARVKERQEVFRPKDSALDRHIQEISGGNEFLANILRYATRKVEVRDQNAQAAQLAQDYEQQLPANQQSLDDE